MSICVVLLCPQVLKRPEYFGRFGKIHKVVINNSTSYAGSQVSCWVTQANIHANQVFRVLYSSSNKREITDWETILSSFHFTRPCCLFVLWVFIVSCFISVGVSTLSFIVFVWFQGPSASAYVTYIRSEDALRAIQCVNNVVVDGRTLKVTNWSQFYSCWVLTF